METGPTYLRGDPHRVRTGLPRTNTRLPVANFPDLTPPSRRVKQRAHLVRVVRGLVDQGAEIISGEWVTGLD